MSNQDNQIRILIVEISLHFETLKIYDLLKCNKTTKVQFIKYRNTNSFWYPIDIQMFFYLHYISLSFLHYSIEKELSRYYKNQLQFVHFRVPMRQRINLWLISKVIYQLIALYIATTGTKHLEMPTNVWFRVHGLYLLGHERTTWCIYLSHSHKSLEVQERHDLISLLNKPSKSIRNPVLQCKMKISQSHSEIIVWDTKLL